MRLPLRTAFVGVIVGVALTVAACSTSGDTNGTDPERTGSTAPSAPLSLTLVEVGSGFDAPVLLVADSEGGADLVVEQSGRIVRNDAEHSVVVDITDDVLFAGEQGLLGLAFHPQFADNGLGYVNYVDGSGTTTIEEFTMVDGVFDTASRRTILKVDKPAPNHNGGMVAFGPDGYLWIGMGDGGSANDRFDQAQDAATLLGAMLRIDIDDGGGERPYGIPQDNPFADGAGGAPEVWAIGLRNPWRFSFDGTDLWIADVGQNAVEEIDLVDATAAGLNFGWPIVEGSMCLSDDGCDATPYVAPVVEYSHDEGCSITGGYVYSGTAIPELQGQYFYSDFCSGFLRSYTPGGGVVDWTGGTGSVTEVASFGVGGDGELYVVSRKGSVFRVEAES